MIISVRNTKQKLVIPEGYKKLKAKNPLQELKNNKDGIDVYQKCTPNANCLVLTFKTDAEHAMNPEDLQGLIDGIHGALGGNQGLIVAENGTTERGYKYIYSIVRSVGSEERPTGANYHLRLNLEKDNEYTEISADFIESGTTGMRDSMGVNFAMSAKLIHPTEEDSMNGWREDPYAPEFEKGLPMNLSEREGLDGIFPDHPLSQAREFVHAVLCDELMQSATDSGNKEQKETSSQNNRDMSERSTDTVDSPKKHEEMTSEEMYRWLLSKDVKRRFIPVKIEIEPNKEKRKLPPIDFRKVKEAGVVLQSEGLATVKKGAIAAKDGAVKAAGVVQEKSKEAQMTMLTYVDKKKNARFLKAKLSAFEDGMKEGKIQAVDYIKKYANFCLASTAISYYYARCDGSIDEAEMLEIEHDLDSIIKNRDLPEALRNKLAEISNKKDLTFEEVSVYLDGVGIDTLKEFARDIDEIIMADENITPEEQRAKAEFETYITKRLEAEKNE